MEFETEDNAYKFYNTYAFSVGFSIRKSSVHKDSLGKVKTRTFCCSCQGHREEDVVVLQK